ncbi:MAG: SAM-dependent methyltransferase [Vicinamibacterales bacterium]
MGGSFRDPSGFVFARGGVIYRQVNKCYRPHYDQLMRSGLAQDLMDRGWLVRHEELAVDPVGGAAYKVLRPELIRFISYPYEWSFSQLRDAALLTLRIQQQALKLGMSLKDASAYNVQFLRGRPILIDTLSFEPSVEGRPWVAYRQFCQHFLAPLALMCYCDVRLGQLLRSLLDGVPLDLASKLLPARTRLKPTLAMHVHLHARAQKRHGGQTPAVSGRTLSRSALVGILDSLATAIQHLRWRPAGTEWIGYYDDTNYSETAMAEKERLVDQMMLRLAPTTVWDLGANVGRFSRLASAKRVDTIAFDVDAAAVETNYLRSVADGDQHLLPLVMDLTNPSASVGWAGCERRSLQERGPADLVLALALIHHLAIGNNVPLPRIADWLDQIARNVVIEFVPKTDSQVRRMLASRGDIFDGYSQQAFEAAFERRFSVEAMTQIPGTDRVLYQLRRRRP